MTVFLLVLLVAVVHVSLPLNVQYLTDPALHHAPLSFLHFHPADKWTPFSGDWALAAGVVDSPADGQASRMHADRPWKKRRSGGVQRSSSTFIRALDARRSSPSNVIGVPMKTRRPGFLRTFSHQISYPPSVPDHVSTDGGRWRRKSSLLSGDERFHGGRRRASHPVYLGMGNDAVDAAYTAYLDIVASTSARNQRKAALNPVTFVGRR